MKKTLTGLFAAAFIVFMTMILFGKPVESKAAGKLPAPQVSAGEITDESISIEWKSLSGADGYIIYKYNSKQKKYKSCKTVNGRSETSCVITGLKPGKSYKFKVAAFVEKNGKKKVQSKSKVLKVKTLTKEIFTPDDFYVYDQNGNKINLSDFTGKPVIVNIWATWCGPCIRELPHFEKYYKEYGDKIQFLMVNCESKWDIDNVTQFIREEGYTFPVYYDFDGSADKAYGTGYIPVTVAITKNGEIIYHDSGSLDEGTLKDLVEKVQK